MDGFLSNFYEESWPKNSCILNQKKFLFNFHVLLSGRVKMYQIDEFSEKEHTLFLLKEGDVFDMFCVLDGCQHNVFYECLDDIRVLVSPMNKIRSWLNDNPIYYQRLLAYTGKLMRMLEENVNQLIFTDISTRLLKLILKNIDDKSQKLEHINDLPNKEIAHLIGSTRAVVNRHLQKLKKNGSIKLGRNKLEIRDLSLLIEELNKSKNRI